MHVYIERVMDVIDNIKVKRFIKGYWSIYEKYNQID